MVINEPENLEKKSAFSRILDLLTELLYYLRAMVNHSEDAEG